MVPGSGVIGRLGRSGHVPIGYLGDPEKSVATFVESQETCWSLPGDMATVEADGTIKVLGRGSLSINTGGEKVFPDEVEAAVKAHPDVVDAIVVGVPDERFGERVVAVIEARPGATLGTEDLRKVCNDKLTGYKISRQVVTVDRVQRSPSGKPDYPWAKQVAVDAINNSTTPGV